MSFSTVNKEYISNKKEYKEKNVFNDSRKEMHLRIWNSYLVGISNNPELKKKEVCEKMGLKCGTIDSIKKLYKLESPFRFNIHKKKASSEAVEAKRTIGSKIEKRSNKKGAMDSQKPIGGEQIGAINDYDKDFEEMSATL
jgi:hypothetical protein